MVEKVHFGSACVLQRMVSFQTHSVKLIQMKNLEVIHKLTNLCLCLYIRQKDKHFMWHNKAANLGEQHITCHCGLMQGSHSLARAVCHVKAHLKWLYQSFQPSITQMSKTSERQKQLQCSLFYHILLSGVWIVTQCCSFQTDGHAYLFVFPFLRCQWDTGYICVHKQPFSERHQNAPKHNQLLPCQVNM